MHHVRPGLTDEVEWRDTALVIELDVFKHPWVRRAGRLLGPLDGGVTFLLFRGVVAIFLFIFILGLRFLTRLGGWLISRRRVWRSFATHGLHLLDRHLHRLAILHDGHGLRKRALARERRR